MTVALITDLVRSLWPSRKTVITVTVDPNDHEIIVALKVFNADSAQGEWDAFRRTKTASVEVALSALHIWLMGVAQSRVEAVPTARAEGEA